MGVEQDSTASACARKRAPGCLVRNGDFFTWATKTPERFECAAGNPPFIRYQRFTGAVRKAALDLCSEHGAVFSSLSSSWAPFIVGTALLLKRGGRMAFVVPAEIGHAPYAAPVLDFLAGHFGTVQVVAIQRKLFRELSEDCWLLYADGYGGTTDHFLLSPMTQFGFMERPPNVNVRVPVSDWRRWRCRLRSFLLSSEVRELYRQTGDSANSVPLGEIARVGIGYVTGANEFFHLRPSQASRLGIPSGLLQPSVRSGKSLNGRAVTRSKVEAWRRRDEPMLLLRLSAHEKPPASVRRYLDSPEGRAARQGYKCRNRSPWYVVPDVVIPDAFLSYMSGDGPALVANPAGCAGTNSVHVVRLKGGTRISQVQRAWRRALTTLSCEIEGHPLGGGVLKLEPREASHVMLSLRDGASRKETALIREGIHTMRQWRHHA